MFIIVTTCTNTLALYYNKILRYTAIQICKMDILLGKKFVFENNTYNILWF